MSDSTMRITGIASGLGTDSIISVLVEARSKPINNLKDEIDADEVQLDAYSKIQTLLNDLADASAKLSTSTTWNTLKATSSNEDVLSAAVTSSASTGTYKIKVNTIASQAAAIGTEQSGSAKFGGSFSIKVGAADATTINIASGSSLPKVVSAINDAKAGVTASIINNTLVITNDTYGASSAITMTDGSSGVLKSLGVLNSSGSYTNYTAGTDLSATINGVAVSGTSNSVTPVTGLTINFADSSSGSAVTLKVSHDTSTLKDAVNDFLDSYNVLNDYIEKQTYVGTTSDGEATSAGALQGQYYIYNLQNQLFSYMSKTINNSELNSKGVNNLYKLGVTRDDSTGDYSISDGDAFDKALSENFEDVKNLFMGSDANGYYGIAKTMNLYVKDSVLDKLDGSLPNIIDNLNDDISTKQDRITNLNTSLLAYETTLYEHFASMENMVQSWNSQLQYLLSQLGNTSGK